MKANVAYAWKHRWCRIPMWLALLFGIACLHPFIRQLVFGPTIDGIPRCAWEDAVRANAHAGEPRSTIYQVLERIGLVRTEHGGLPLNAGAALPVYLDLADDKDPAVRKLALHELSTRMGRNEAAILPTMRRHLNDDDAPCRLIAVTAVWRAKKDPVLLGDLQPLTQEADRQIRYRAAALLAEMAQKVPETFGILAALTEDPDALVRATATLALVEFGQRADVILRGRLTDADTGVRRAAIIALVRSRKEPPEFSSDLHELRNDPDPAIRAAVAGLPPGMPLPRFGAPVPPPP